jgi:hypothetical protein
MKVGKMTVLYFNTGGETIDDWVRHSEEFENEEKLLKHIAENSYKGWIKYETLFVGHDEYEIGDERDRMIGIIESRPIYSTHFAGKIEKPPIYLGRCATKYDINIINKIKKSPEY